MTKYKKVKLIYVYDRCGTLVGGKPFFGEEEVAKYIGKIYGVLIDPKRIINNCGPNKDEFYYHYLRTCPTTVFNSAPKVKFQTVWIK